MTTKVADRGKTPNVVVGQNGIPALEWRGAEGGRSRVVVFEPSGHEDSLETTTGGGFDVSFSSGHDFC